MTHVKDLCKWHRKLREKLLLSQPLPKWVRNMVCPMGTSECAAFMLSHGAVSPHPTMPVVLRLEHGSG